MSRELQDNMFDKLSNLNLLKFAIKLSQDSSKAETLCLTFFSIIVNYITNYKEGIKVCEQLYP